MYALKRSPTRSSVTETYEHITPEVAAEFLATMPPHQRRPKPTHIHYLVRQITQGLWDEEVSSIKFDTEGRMIDGQHRCLAILRAKTPATIRVRRGYPPHSILKLDQGAAPRSVADALIMLGGSHTALTAAALRFLWLYENRKPLYISDKVAGHELEELFARHRQMEHSAVVAYGTGRAFGSGIPAGALAFVHYLLSQVGDAEEADEFFTYLREGTNLSENSPILRLRNKLLVGASNRTFMSYRGKLMLMKAVIHAWNHWRKGSELRSFAIPGGDELPKII